jgi:hypothetical protein
MALQASGAISMGNINTELSLSATAQISLNDASVRSLAGVPSGAISLNNFYGKAAPPTTIGQSYGGGYYAGQISQSNNSVATHYLIVSPRASGQGITNFRVPFGGTPTAQSFYDGATNSANMNSPTHPAASFCEGLTIGGYSDWYLPAKLEQEIVYYNLKPATTSNFAPNLYTTGQNSYAVPSRSSYTGGNPAQTSVGLFQTSNTEAYGSGGTASQQAYWSSTNFSTVAFAWCQYFSNGFMYPYFRNDSGLSVRAIRKVAV